MNQTVYHYFQKGSSSFYEVIPLHESQESDWNVLSRDVPTLPRGWYELAKLPLEDRIEFSTDFWIKTLPYHPRIHDALRQFFLDLDDIGVFITKKTKDSPFVCHLVYSMDEDAGFYYGRPPFSKEEIAAIVKGGSVTFPKDYLSFFEIHNGFKKHGDTGMFPLEKLEELTREFQMIAGHLDKEIFAGKELVHSASLFPFYRSFGLDVYQCFYKEWYADEGMGNVLCSLHEGYISDFHNRNTMMENLAFPAFLDWLIFYLDSLHKEFIV